MKNNTNKSEESGKIASGYSKKPANYFSGARKAFIDDLPINPQARLLEIGCGNGDTSAYAIATGKCGWCAGVEICAEPANEARQRLNEVIVGDVEDLKLPFPDEYFDILIMSEVIEHLRDPWTTLIKLRNHMKPGSLVMAGSPNVAHFSVILMLLQGRWEYTNVGIMDGTHLRWFTPSTYKKLFQDSGFEVIYVGPVSEQRRKVSLINNIFLRKIKHLFHAQIYLIAKR